jgi:hypothetical protein
MVDRGTQLSMAETGLILTDSIVETRENFIKVLKSTNTSSY